MTDTQPFMDEARALARKFYATPFAEEDNLLATALSSAYQRGREEERERCAEIVERRERAARNLRLAKAQSQPDHCGYHLHEEQTAKAIATAIRTERDKG